MKVNSKKMINKAMGNGYSLMAVTTKVNSIKTEFMEEESIIILRESLKEFGNQIY